MLERLKRLNFKKFTRGFAIVWMIIFIVVMTITNIGIDEHFDWLKWLGSALILFGITVFGLFIGESLGNDFSKEPHHSLHHRLKRFYKPSFSCNHIPPSPYIENEAFDLPAHPVKLRD